MDNEIQQTYLKVPFVLSIGPAVMLNFTAGISQLSQGYTCQHREQNWKYFQHTQLKKERKKRCGQQRTKEEQKKINN